MVWKFTGFLIAQGYKKSSSNDSLFTFDKESNFTAFLVYVGDAILAWNSIEEIERIKITLDAEFKIKDRGKFKYFLGIKVINSKIGFSNFQKKVLFGFVERYMSSWLQACQNFSRSICQTASRFIQTFWGHP